MTVTADVEVISHAIELAVAPVFLLAGVGAILSVLTTRLARAVDRSRILQERQSRAADARDLGAEENVTTELSVLEQRIRIVNIAIVFCVLCSLCICAVVAVIFLALAVDMPVAAAIVWSFVFGMFCLFVALSCLLREVYLATMKMPIRR